jgi:hypothetical protein
MPCGGVAVVAATVALNIEERFNSDEELRSAMVADLVASGFEAAVRRSGTSYVITLGPRTTISFSETQVSVVGARGAAREALSVIKRYVSELVQKEVLDALQAQGLQISNVRLDEAGTVLFDFAQ